MAIFYIFHWIALKHTTFHRLNRLFLLSGLCLSFILPIIRWPEQSIFQANKINDLVVSFEGFILNESESGNDILNNTRDYPYLKIITVVLYSIVSLSIIFRLLKNIQSIRSLKKGSQLVQVDDICFYSGPEIKQPFTFLKWIFIPFPRNEKTFELSILRHENAHAIQWHTIDILFIELISIFFWFNPFVFLFRLAIKQVHEYLADDEATSSFDVKADYLRLLVSNVRLSDFSKITSQFYWLTLKKRIQMITKDKSPLKHKLRYFLILPVLVVSTLAFSRFNINQDIDPGKTDNIPSVSPIKKGEYKISSEYGMREHPITKQMKMHQAIDLKAESGTKVMATADGRVVKLEFLEEGKGYGKLILIQHNNSYSTIYAQLSSFKVQVGDRVKKGEVIGYVGSSGLSTGSHLHYEVIKNGERVNPEDYF
jgi:murein DD-endopeptidase MepM/ murein hydrolase activator NlpD